MAVEWVALFTFVNESAGMFYEEGGVYPDEPCCSWTEAARELQPDEHVALCPRCGHRFANTMDGRAEFLRDLHFDGDDDCPSICRNFPPRQLQLVKG